MKKLLLFSLLVLSLAGCNNQKVNNEKVSENSWNNPKVETTKLKKQVVKNDEKVGEKEQKQDVVVETKKEEKLIRKIREKGEDIEIKQRCKNEDGWYICKDEQIAKKKIEGILKDVKTLKEIQNKNYKQIRGVVYKCNGSLYQTKSWKNIPWYYCKTNGKDYLQQFEYIDGKWNKICIKRVWKKDYFKIKKLEYEDSYYISLDRFLYSRKTLDRLLYSRKTLDKILEDVKWDYSCGDLKSLFYVKELKEYENQRKVNEEDIREFEKSKVVIGWWGLDERYKNNTKDIEYIYDPYTSWVIWFKNKGYNCLKVKQEQISKKKFEKDSQIIVEELIYTWENYDSFLCFKWEMYYDENFWISLPFVVQFSSECGDFIINSKVDFLSVCKRYYPYFIMKWNYCIWSKILDYAPPSWNGSGLNLYLAVWIL